MVSCWEDSLVDKVQAGLLKFKAAASTPGGHSGSLLSLRALEVKTGDVWSTLTGKKIRKVPNISFWFSHAQTQACSLHSCVPTYMPVCECTHTYTHTTYTYTCKTHFDEHNYISCFMKPILYWNTESNVLFGWFYNNPIKVRLLPASLGILCISQAVCRRETLLPWHFGTVYTQSLWDTASSIPINPKWPFSTCTYFLLKFKCHQTLTHSWPSHLGDLYLKVTIFILASVCKLWSLNLYQNVSFPSGIWLLPASIPWDLTSQMLTHLNKVLSK